jgi:hypothetical protein
MEVAGGHPLLVNAAVGARSLPYKLWEYDKMLFRNPLAGVMRPLILFDLQVTICRVFGTHQGRERYSQIA